MDQEKRKKKKFFFFFFFFLINFSVNTGMYSFVRIGFPYTELITSSQVSGSSGLASIILSWHFVTEGHTVRGFRVINFLCLVKLHFDTQQYESVHVTLPKEDFKTARRT